jgi:tetratricopeptide (TPR) repeat protein
MGRSREVVEHIEQGRRLYDPHKHAQQAFEYGGHDAGACSHWHLGLTHWVLGYPDRAVKEAEEGVRMAKELRHPMTMVIALWFAAWVQLQRGDVDRAAAPAEESIEISRTYGIPRWGDAAILMHSRLKAEEHLLSRLEQGIREMSGTAWRKANNLSLLARMHAERGNPQTGRDIIASIPAAHRSGFFCADILRTEGEIILACDNSAIREAEACFQRALDTARARSERSLELRAATNLARLWQGQGRREEGYRLLDPIYRWFTEGFDTADLKAAKALLSELGGTAPAAR